MKSQPETANLKTPDEINQDIVQTREAITEKVAALENQVVGTVRSAVETLSDTVGGVKSIITEAPEAVTQTVKHAMNAVSEFAKDTFDLSGHTRRFPWETLAGSVGIGCLIGWLTYRAPTRAINKSVNALADRPGPVSEPPSNDHHSMVDEFVTMIKDELRVLAKTTLDSVSSVLTETVRGELPPLMNKKESSH